MSLPSAWEELREEDLPNDDLREIAREYSLPVAVGIWKKFRGANLMLPTRFPREYSMAYIGRHWNGNNTAQLARSLGISQRTVFDFLGKSAKRHGANPEQLSLI